VTAGSFAEFTCSSHPTAPLAAEPSITPMDTGDSGRD
jgi:hypothetical protein